MLDFVITIAKYNTIVSAYIKMQLQFFTLLTPAILVNYSHQPNTTIRLIQSRAGITATPVAKFRESGGWLKLKKWTMRESGESLLSLRGRKICGKMKIHESIIYLSVSTVVHVYDRSFSLLGQAKEKWNWSNENHTCDLSMYTMWQMKSVSMKPPLLLCLTTWSIQTDAIYFS